MGSATGAGLDFVRLADASTAVGLAVRFTMAEPAYAAIEFGKWARVLDGQAARGHYGFVVDAKKEIVGFAGWALTSEAKAEAWAEGRDPLTDADCRAGECLIFNAWIAKGAAVHRFLLESMRPVFADKKTLYFRRAYSDGSTRTVRLPVNEAVESHIARLADRQASPNDAQARTQAHAI